MRPDRLLEIVV
uniref:Uncharacterized protein n=1 Tax=Zea mays TaxID=4577 RepID=B4FMU5_MAIZE|nr:unknown [Zea mays]